MISSGKRESAMSQEGFTLLELVVALTLVALMAVGLWAVLQVSVRSWSRGTEYVDKNQRHRSIIDLVRKQMASAYALYTQGNQLTGEIPYPVFSGKEEGVTFVSLNSLRFQESPGLTLVSYGISQADDGSYALVEKEQPYLGQLPEEGSTVDSKEIPVFEKLSSCILEYYDPGDVENEARWVSEWDGRQLGRLPAAISLTMISKDAAGRDLNRHMVVPVKAGPNLRNNMFNPQFMRQRRGRR